MQDISVPEINAMDPGTLNSFFSGKQVYDREGNIQWDPLSSALNVSLERINGISAMRKTDLTALLSEGIYPIVRVRVKGLGNFHYVLLVKPGRTVLVHGSPPCRRGACPAVGLREPYLCHPLSVPPLTYSEP